MKLNVLSLRRACARFGSGIMAATQRMALMAYYIHLSILMKNKVKMLYIKGLQNKDGPMGSL